MLFSKKTKIKFKKILYPFFNIFSKKYIVKRVDIEPSKSILVEKAILELAENIDFLKHQKVLEYDGTPKILKSDIKIDFYEDVYIDLHTGVVVNKDKDIIIQSLKNLDRTETDLAKLDKYVEIKEELISVINPHLNVGYFHIWFDGIIKLYYLNKLDKKVTIVLCKKDTKIFNNVLELFKDKFKVIYIDDFRFIKVRNACVVKHLYWAKHAPYFNTKMANFFSPTILNNSSNIQVFDKIYIKRKGTSRSIINNKEVESIFKKFGFEIISFEDYTIFEQARLVNNAQIIAGLHGAGFTNLIFSKPNLTLIELQNHAVVPSYYFMSYQLSLKYYPIFSLTTNVDEIRDPYKEREKFYSQKLEPVRYDINEIKSVLEKI